jgi:2,5-diketo-D-gluconate reductase A
MTDIPRITLNDGARIPQLGLGVFQIPPADTAQAVRTALEAGYRHIDTAQMYGNEQGVGQAVAESGIPRSEVFVTTKLGNDQHGYDAAMRALDASLQQLGTDYVDLYLIHWPRPRAGRFVDAWKGCEKLHADGRARSIGVSNFQPEHLDRLAAETGTVPAVNQIELHPQLQQPQLREYHRRHGIATQAWSPIAKGQIFDDETISSLAAKYGKSPAQLILRWHLQLGNIVFPKSVTASRMRENLDIFDFEIADDDMAAITPLDVGRRTGPDPETFG